MMNSDNINHQISFTVIKKGYLSVTLMFLAQNKCHRNIIKTKHFCFMTKNIQNFFFLNNLILFFQLEWKVTLSAFDIPDV